MIMVIRSEIPPSDKWIREQKIKDSETSLRKFLQTFSPNLHFSLIQVCVILNCSFLSILVTKRPSTWNFWWACTQQGNTTETPEILWAGDWFPRERLIPSCLFRLQEARDKLSGTKRFWKVWRHFQTERDSWRIPDCPLPIQKAFPPRPLPFRSGLTEGTAKDGLLLPSSDSTKVPLWLLV